MYGENGKNWYGDRPILIHDAPPLVKMKKKDKKYAKRNDLINYKNFTPPSIDEKDLIHCDYEMGE